MSPRAGSASSSPPSFPRVSGDEPWPRVVVDTIEEFSLRERG